MKARSLKLSLALFVLVSLSLLLSACQFAGSRNEDGSWTVETSISQEDLQQAINAAIADPLIKDLTVSLQDGYALVSAERQRLNDASRTDALTFRLDLGVSNGQLIASVSNATLDGVPIESERVNHWNETIASRLQKIGQKRPNTSLQSVSITPQGVNMTWLVDNQ
jgi:hypothetical protein